MKITPGARTVLAKTCVVCGVFQMANRFRLVSGKYRNSWCLDCNNACSREATKKHQQKARTAAQSHRQPWTGEDLNLLDQMVSEGRTGPEMALALNRTVYAVYTMKNKLFKEI